MQRICCSFHFELSRKLKQRNIIFLIMSIAKRKAVSVLQVQKYKIEQSQKSLSSTLIVFGLVQILTRVDENLCAFNQS